MIRCEKYGWIDSDMDRGMAWWVIGWEKYRWMDAWMDGLMDG
jgi:hypothetical protein